MFQEGRTDTQQSMDGTSAMRVVVMGSHLKVVSEKLYRSLISPPGDCLPLLNTEPQSPETTPSRGPSRFC